MPNYYYDAPDRFTPDETVEIVVPMEQPAENITCPYYLFRVNKSTATFQNNYWAGRDGNQIRHKKIRVRLPYPLGARVGVRDAWFNYFTDNSGKTYFRDTAPHIPYSSFDEPETMPDDAIRHWYTVTAVDVVNQDGRWVERVTMRRDT